MDDQPYKLDVRIGAAEFHAEGPESSVRSDFEMFLSAVKATAPDDPGESAGESPGSPPAQSGVNRALLERVYDVASDGTVSLRLLPPDGPSRAADTAILVLYGYRALAGVAEVPVTKLNDGMRKSGISVTRLDRFIGVHSQYFMKGGTRSGGRYQLNNQGAAAAERMIKQWFQ